MVKIKKTISKKETLDIKGMLDKARNRYDNELIRIEKIWSSLKQGDYDRRKSVLGVLAQMNEIDQSLKAWENKLKTES